MIKRINRKLTLEGNINIYFDLEIPLGIPSINFDDSDIENMLINQYLRGIRSAILSYRNSELPSVFLEDQNIVVTNKLPEDIYGAMTMVGDTMIIDADAISDIRAIEASFLFAHEMGHKIIKYRPMKDSRGLVSSFLGVNEHAKKLIDEALSDEMGNMSVGFISSANRFNHLLRSSEHHRLQYTILKDVYRV